MLMLRKFQVTVINILHLAIIFVLSHESSLKYSLFGNHICFCKCLWSVKFQSQIFYIWQPYFFFSIYVNLHIPCLTDIFVFFFLFMPTHFKLYTHVYLYTQWSCLWIFSDSHKYFTFVTHICSFTYIHIHMHTYVCLHVCVWVYECMYKHKHNPHTSACMYTYIYPYIHTHTVVFMYA